MNDEKYLNLFNLLKNITPHSDILKEFLKSKGYYNKKNKQKSLIIEQMILNDNKSIPERNLITQNGESKIKELENFLDKNKNIDISSDEILKKLEEIEKEIISIKNEDNKDKAIKDLKVIEQFKKQKDNNEKTLKNIQNKEKKKQQNTEKEKSEAELIRLRDEKENIERDKKNRIESKILKELDQERKNKEKSEIIKGLNEEKKLKEEENKRKLNIEIKNREKILKDEERKRNNTKRFENTNFIEKVINNKNNVQKAKNTLKEYSLDSKETAIQEVNNLENQAKALQNVINSIQASGNQIPQELLTHLQEILDRKGTIESALNTLSGMNLQK